MLKKLFNSFSANFHKLVPMFVLIGLAYLFAGTDFFSKAMHGLFKQALLQYIERSLPFALNLLASLLVLNIAWILYPFVIGFVEAVLKRISASDRGKELSLQLAKFLFWVIVLVVVLTVVAPELLSKMVIFGAALTLALQGVANDFICGRLIEGSRKVEINDRVKIEGMDVTGKVLRIGYLSIAIQAEDSVIQVPNREVWSRAVRVLKPEKSKIILPDGFEKIADASVEKEPVKKRIL